MFKETRNLFLNYFDHIDMSYPFFAGSLQNYMQDPSLVLPSRSGAPNTYGLRLQTTGDGRSRYVRLSLPMAFFKNH
jgi:hypothetical protein